MELDPLTKRILTIVFVAVVAIAVIVLGIEPSTIPWPSP